MDRSGFRAAATVGPLHLMAYALDGSKDDFVGRWMVQAQLGALHLLN